MASTMMTDDSDFPELTDEQLARLRPAREIMPPEFFAVVKRQDDAPPKVSISLQIDAETFDAYKAEGSGWRSRMEEDLTSAVERRRRASQS